MSTAASTAAAQRSRTHKIAVTAMLSAAATVLMFLEFPIPFLIQIGRASCRERV